MSVESFLTKESLISRSTLPPYPIRNWLQYSEEDIEFREMKALHYRILKITLPFFCMHSADHVRVYLVL